jgi:uncharacterized protein (DUF302 family)
MQNHRAAAAAAVICLAAAALAPSTHAQPQPPTERIETEQGFDELVEHLKAAVEANEMVVVTQACASCGAAKRGVEIPGNMVLGVYRNDFAVRMLAASVPAGIEAPIRFYVTEGADGKAALSYRMPSAVFAPYGSADLAAMAKELDQIWQKIADDAVGRKGSG